MEVTDLPFNQFIGLERSESDSASLALPAHERYTNHLGTVHASALLALAEAASGDFLIRRLGGNDGEFVPVVRRLEAKFNRPATGEIHSRVDVTDERFDEMLTRLSEKGKAVLAIPVQVLDEAGVKVLTAEIQWFITKTPIADE